MSIQIYPPLYSQRLDGKYQIWWMERDGNKYRSHSGIFDIDVEEIIESSHIVSEYKFARAKNVGQSNMKTAEEQADFEVNRRYTVRKENGFVYKIGDAPYFAKIKPMLAEKYQDRKKLVDEEFQTEYGVWSQPKLDGIRCIITQEGMFSRNWKPIVSAPHIFEELKPLLEQGYVFDGELYAHSLKEDFEKIISLTRKTKPTPTDLDESYANVEYWIFDMINEDYFSERYNAIKKIISENNFRMIKLTEAINVFNQEDLDKVYESYLIDGYEGQMIRFDDVYEHRRTSSLIKRKDFIDEEFEIIEVIEGTGNWAGTGKTVLCKNIPGRFNNENGEKFKATIKNSYDYCVQVLKEKNDYIGGTATVRYQNLSVYGVPRFPIAVTIYKGKRWDTEETEEEDMFTAFGEKRP